MSIAMTESEIVQYLHASSVAAIGTVTRAGTPYVEPAAYVCEDPYLYVMLNRDVSSVAMDLDETTELLSKYRFPRTGTPLFLAAATLRKDGSCYVSPLGMHWDGEFVYFHLLETRAMLVRLRRNPLVTIASYTRSFPMRAVIVEGVAEEVEADDPARAYSHEIVRSNFEAPVYEGMLTDHAMDNHETVPTVLFRVRPRNLVAWDDAKSPSGRTLTPGRNFGARARVFISMTTTHMPLQVLHATGDAEVIDDPSESRRWTDRIVERHSQSPDSTSSHRKISAAGHHVYRVSLDSVMAWDQAKDASYEDGAGYSDIEASWIQADRLWST